LERIPLRIGVTGTRGKSSVVRQLAAVLREDGRRVLAKTTGTEPRIILPDGGEIIPSRRGSPTILEQKSVIKKAADLGVDCLIVEIMSIRPESHFVESHQLIRPELLLITNVRKDHVDAMGHSEEEIASVFSLDIVAGAKVLVPHSERRGAIETIEKMTRRKNGELIWVNHNGEASGAGDEFLGQNQKLLSAAAQYLQVDRETIQRGIEKAGGDEGRLRIWRIGKDRYAANAFAANDPQSTMAVLSRVKELLPSYRGRIAGLLNLRSDRPDRSQQWSSALRGGSAAEFSSLFVIGGHSHAVKRQLGEATILRGSNPEEIMSRLLAQTPERTLFFGFGNMGGWGRKLVQYWARIGDEHGI
jgi:poly-gamma-glutamate synthase PgsB/CapB